MLETNKILILAAKLLNYDESVIAEVSTDVYTRNLLIDALNIVISEIAEEYIPVFDRQVRVSEDKRIDFDTLPYKVFKIKKIIKNGKSVKFQEYTDYVEMEEEGEFEVIYSYVPNKTELGGNINFPPCVSERCLAFGTAAEFALIREMHEESDYFNNRYLTALFSARRNMKELRLPYRGCL